jgi:hypothetical protein
LSIGFTQTGVETVVLECIDNMLASWNSMLMARDIVLSAIKLGSVTAQ